MPADSGLYASLLVLAVVTLVGSITYHAGWVRGQIAGYDRGHTEGYDDGMRAATTPVTVPEEDLHV